MKFNESLDVNLFVQNLLNEDKLLEGFGDGRLCTPPAGQAATAELQQLRHVQPVRRRRPTKRRGATACR